MSREFDVIIQKLTERIRRTLLFIPDEIKEKCEEIRLRSSLPVCLTIEGKVFFVNQDSSVLKRYGSECIVATQSDVDETLSLLCERSIYIHEKEINQGFISLSNGCRAGVCGVFNAEGTLTKITSINLRIARQVVGCAKPLLNYTEGGLLIAGPPSSGKTTMLRDVIRLLSNGRENDFYRVAVVDSRGEISGDGVCDLGINTDVLYLSDKGVGVEIALRTLSPNFICFDELGTEEELLQIENCLNAGVDVITTVHCRDKIDLKRRTIIKKLLESNAIKWVALLPKNRGDSVQIFSVKELENAVFY